MGHEYAPKSLAPDNHTLVFIYLNDHVAFRDMKSSPAILALGGDITGFLARIDRSDRNTYCHKIVAQSLVSFLLHSNEHFGAVFRQKGEISVIEKRLDNIRRGHKVSDGMFRQFF